MDKVDLYWNNIVLEQWASTNIHFMKTGIKKYNYVIIYDLDVIASP